MELSRNIIIYSLSDADETGIIDHPQQVVENLGMKVLAFEGYPIADCVFMEVHKIIDNLPAFIKQSDYDMIVKPELKLSMFSPDGNARYINWTGNQDVTLDGVFTVKELEQLVRHIDSRINDK